MKALAVLRQGQNKELEGLLEKAVDWHGHFGPFLVLGVRMGLVGTRELGEKRGDPKLRVTVMTRPSVPFSCVIDGIQASTGCTIGNRKLRLRDSQKSIAAKFRISERNSVTVTLNPAKQEELEKLLSRHPSLREMEEIASNVISTPEKGLFNVKKK